MKRNEVDTMLASIVYHFAHFYLERQPGHAPSQVTDALGQFFNKHGFVPMENQTLWPYIRRRCVTEPAIPAADIPEPSPAAVIPMSLLQLADDIIHGERVHQYGPAAETFVDVATVATIFTGKELTPSDCLLMQIAQKLVRNRVTPKKRDHRLDAAGYLGILDDVMMKEDLP